jgi:hypothetical protein
MNLDIDEKIPAITQPTLVLYGQPLHLLIQTSTNAATTPKRGPSCYHAGYQEPYLASPHIEHCPSHKPQSRSTRRICSNDHLHIQAKMIPSQLLELLSWRRSVFGQLTKITASHHRPHHHHFVVSSSLVITITTSSVFKLVPTLSPEHSR